MYIPCIVNLMQFFGGWGLAFLDLCSVLMGNCVLPLAQQSFLVGLVKVICVVARPNREGTLPFGFSQCTFLLMQRLVFSS